MRKRIVTVFSLMVCALSLVCTLTCCSDEKEEPDGIWESMEWKTDVKMGEGGNISSSYTGGTYVFECTNYKHVWISEVWEKTEDGQEIVYPLIEVDGDYNNMETPWGKTSIMGSLVTIEIYPNRSLQKRIYQVLVTAGDTFYCFSFNQAPEM